MKKLIYGLMMTSFVTLVACTPKDKSNEESGNSQLETAALPVDNFTGVYTDPYDGSKLEIGKDTNSGLKVTIDIVGLTLIDDGIGKVAGDTLEFTATDANGDPIGGKVALDGDTATLVFTNSTWDYLPNGTSFRFVRSASDDK